MEEVLPIDWEKYFQSIQRVCPWSLESYLAGRIKITKQDIIQDLKEYDAIVYQVDMSIDELDNFVEKLNDIQEECEFLWSHPDHTKGGNNQTPVPVVIQQDRKFLEKLRKGEKGGINSKAKETSKGPSSCNSKKAKK
mgnify:CR=1 FL=1